MVGHKILEINKGEQGQLSNTETNMEAFVDFLDFKCFFFIPREGASLLLLSVESRHETRL